MGSTEHVGHGVQGTFRQLLHPMAGFECIHSVGLYPVIDYCYGFFAQDNEKEQK